MLFAWNYLRVAKKFFSMFPLLEKHPMGKPHTTHNPLIRSDKGLELKISVFNPFPELNWLFPTQLKEANVVPQKILVLQYCKNIMYSAAKAIDN